VLAALVEERKPRLREAIRLTGTTVSFGPPDESVPTILQIGILELARLTRHAQG